MSQSLSKSPPTAVTETASRFETPFARAVLHALELVRRTVRVGDDLVPFIGWERFNVLEKDAAPDAETLYLRITLAGAEAEPIFGGRFNMIDPLAVQYARTQVGNLISMLRDDALPAIRDVVSTSLRGGLTPQQAARLIRQVIGLNQVRAQAVANYRVGLTQVMNGTLAPSAVDVQLADARFTHTGLTPAKVDTMVARYAERHLVDRAKLIARTETLKAAHAGQRMNWDAAADQGLFDRGSARVVWQVADDDRLCPECAPLDGTTVAFEGGTFESATRSDHVTEDPPLHPGCRCTLSLVTD